jgi:Copper type II ascorbate-dependent monooxygenase, C-terminal domain
MEHRQFMGAYSGVILAIGAIFSAGCSFSDPTEVSAPGIDDAYVVHLDEGQFKVGSGIEGDYCMRLPLPAELRDRDLVLVGVDWDVPVYTHHFFMAYTDKPLDSDNPVACTDADPFLPTGAGQPADDRSGPGKLIFGAGVGKGGYQTSGKYGRFMPKGGHFWTDHHVLNTGNDTTNMYGKFDVYLKNAAAVPFPTNQLNCLNMGINLPPHSETEVTATCIVPYDLDLVGLASHAHQHLVLFETRLFDGTNTLPDPIYTSSDWDSPEMINLEQNPLRLKAGQGLTFTCHYRNNEDVTVDYGRSVDSEMCATMNIFALPEDRKGEIPPSLGAIIPTNSTKAMVMDTAFLTELPF